MMSKLLRCLRLEKMIWRRGKSGVISNVEFGMLLILPCVVLASFLSTTVAWHHSPPVACAPSSVPSPPVPSAPSSVPLPPVPSAPSSVPSPPLVPSAPSSVPSPPLVPSAPSSVPSPRLAPSAPSSVPSPPAPFAPRSVPSPPFCSPSAPSPVPSPPFCSRSVATTIGSALFALISLMKDAWGEASAQVSFTRPSVVRSLRRVLLTIVLGLNPIVGTFYVLQTTFMFCRFFVLIVRQNQVQYQRIIIAVAMVDSWVAVGVVNANIILGHYRLRGAFPDPTLVLNFAGTVDAQGNREWPVVPAAAAGGFQFFLLNYEGMLALVLSGALDNADYKQLRFLGRRTSLEALIIILQSMSYITAVVYRRIQHLNVSPIEGIGFACSLLFLVYASVQCVFGSISKQGLLIYLNGTQETALRNYGNPNQQIQWFDPNLVAFILTSLVGLLVAGVATWLVYPVLVIKNIVDMLGHIIFFGGFLLQFIFFILYFRACFGIDANLLLTPLVITGIIALAGVFFASYATIRHWHDQNFDIPTPSLGRYLPFIH
ncbi:unnamed protein product [Sphagnum balticum]